MRTAFLLMATGALLAVLGVGLISVPAAVILAGLSMTGLGLLVAVGQSPRRAR